MSFLDNAGVERLWQKMKAYVALMTGNNLTFDRVYPVGSIYLSVNNVNPGTLFGGTWVAWGSGRVPVGVDVDDADFSTAEKTGGEKKHALTASEGPQHDHDFTGTAESHDHTFTGTSKSYKSGNQSANHTHGFAFNANGPSSNNTAANPGKNLSNCYATNTGTYTALGGTTGNQSASHTHNTTIKPEGTVGSKGITPKGTISKSGSGTAHNNLQPYVTCYMWKRTA